MINFLQKAIEDLGIARYAIDQLLKMDIEQTRMRYCFIEYKDVIPFPEDSSWWTGVQEFDEIMYRDKNFYTIPCKATQR